MSNLEVRLKVLGRGVRRLEQATNQNTSVWFGHVSRLPTERLLSCALFAETGNDEEMI